MQTGIAPPASRVRELFEEVIDLPADARAQVLKQLSATQVEIDAVVELIAADDKRYLFEIPASEWAKQLEDDHEDIVALVGQRAGPYDIVRFLGKGGTSIVFLANRKLGDASQDVALKILHNGLYSSDSRRRFRREQKILSRLSHPNIARLIDAGILDSGTPFIAMEFVDGQDLITYANTHALALDARLKLLIELCRAVDTAHRALIVHRDLKPSNVLVTRDGHVKVLDFGIAKLIDDDDGEPTTATQHIALTPAYAAPEQYSSGPTITSTDVYSLGVIASELLIGERLGPDATWQAELAPTRTTTWRRWRDLDSDLVHILRASLASEPERRYSSAGHLADDIARYLRDEPIEVAPISRWYRARKFVTRHRGSVIAAGLIAATVVVGVIGVLWQAARVNEQGQRANATRDFLVSVFEAAGADLPRDKRPSVDDIVDQASLRLMSTNPTAAGNLPDALSTDMLLTLAKIASSVGSFDRASSLLDQVDRNVARMGDAGTEPAIQTRVLRAAISHEAAHTDKDRSDAIGLLMPIKDRLLARRDRVAIDGLTTLALLLRSDGRTDEALSLIRTTVGIAEKSNVPDALLATKTTEVGMLLDSQRYHEATDRANETLDLWHQQGEPATQAVIDLEGDSALAKESVGDAGGADFSYRQAIALGDRFFDKPTPKTAWYVGIYGTFLVAQGRLDEAEPYVKRGLEMRRTVFGDADKRTLYGLAGMAKLSLARAQYTDGITWLTQGVDTCIAHHMQDLVCARMQALRARAYARIGNLSAADTDIHEALAQQKISSGDKSPAYAWVLYNLAAIQNSRHEYDQVLVTVDQVLAINSKVSGSLLQADLETRYYRAKALFELHREDEALTEILPIESLYAERFPSGGMRWDISALKAAALAHVGRNEEAQAAAKDVMKLTPRGDVDQPVLKAMQALAGDPKENALK